MSQHTWLLVALMLVAAALAGCSHAADDGNGNGNGDGTGNGNGNGDGGGAEVGMMNLMFNPAEVSISVGETVKWINDDALPHTVTADNGTFDSANMDPGDEFTHIFSTAGEYEYVCEYHPPMVGRVVVT